jgi:hypothetical protein
MVQVLPITTVRIKSLEGAAQAVTTEMTLTISISRAEETNPRES